MRVIFNVIHNILIGFNAFIGILMADNDRWKQHRFFLMSALKTLGSNKANKSPRVILEDKIHAALGEFIQVSRIILGKLNFLNFSSFT